MPSLESLIDLVGQSVDADIVQSLIASEQLQASSEEDLEEGEAVRSHLSSQTGGYAFSYTHARLNTLFVHVRPKGTYAAFQGRLVNDLTPESTRSDVRQTLGTPTRSSEAGEYPPLGRYGAWDRFDSERICLHFQYTEPDEKIGMITVMMSDTAP